MTLHFLTAPSLTASPRSGPCDNTLSLLAPHQGTRVHRQGCLPQRWLQASPGTGGGAAPGRRRESTVCAPGTGDSPRRERGKGEADSWVPGFPFLGSGRQLRRGGPLSGTGCSPVPVMGPSLGHCPPAEEGR